MVWTGRRVFFPCILQFEGRIFGLLEGKEVIITAALMRGDTEYGPWVTNQDSANSQSGKVSKTVNSCVACSESVVHVVSRVLIGPTQIVTNHHLAC